MIERQLDDFVITLLLIAPDHVISDEVNAGYWTLVFMLIRWIADCVLGRGIHSASFGALGALAVLFDPLNI